MKKLSVITVTFNAEHTLERTVKSVGEQTYAHIEHIIVDGESTDRTVDIIKKHDNEKMVWKSEPDNGLYEAMNKGIDMATGDYLCFLNAGDTFFAKDTVEELMESAGKEMTTPDILYGETAIVDDKGTFLHMRYLSTPHRLNWKSFRNGMVVCHQAFFVKRELAEPYDLKYKFSSDFDWCIRIMKKAKVIFNSQILLINYLNEGMTTRNRLASLKERYRIMAKHYGHATTFLYHIWFVIRLIIYR